MGNAVQNPQENLQNPLEDDAQKNQDEDHDTEKNQDEDETFTCDICIEPVTLPNIKFKNNNRCSHPFCPDCMIKYIQGKLEENVSYIKCPAMTCEQSLEPLSCRPKITSQLFEKWCALLCESTVLCVDKVYCPNIECAEMILNECGDGNLKRCVCSYCKKPFCFRCKVPWHDGTTCGKTKDENDVAFDNVWKKNHWQRCPKCRHCIERIDGCDVIKCRCGIKFCYKCGKKKGACKHILGDVTEIFLWILVILFFPIVLLFFLIDIIVRFIRNNT